MLDSLPELSPSVEVTSAEEAELAFVGLIQAVEAKDHRTATRLTRYLRQLGWSIVYLGPKRERGRR